MANRKFTVRTDLTGLRASYAQYLEFSKKGSLEQSHLVGLVKEGSRVNQSRSGPTTSCPPDCSLETLSGQLLPDPKQLAGGRGTLGSPTPVDRQWVFRASTSSRSLSLSARIRIKSAWACLSSALGCQAGSLDLMGRGNRGWASRLSRAGRRGRL